MDSATSNNFAPDASCCSGHVAEVLCTLQHAHIPCCRCDSESSCSAHHFRRLPCFGFVQIIKIKKATAPSLNMIYVCSPSLRVLSWLLSALIGVAWDDALVKLVKQIRSLHLHLRNPLLRIILCISISLIILLCSVFSHLLKGCRVTTLPMKTSTPQTLDLSRLVPSPLLFLLILASLFHCLSFRIFSLNLLLDLLLKVGQRSTRFGSTKAHRFQTSLECPLLLVASCY